MRNVEDLFRPALEKALSGGLAHLASLDSSPVAATASLAELRSRFARELGASGLPPVEVVDDLIRDVQGGLLGSAGGRFFAWVIGGSLPAALAADWLTSAWDQNAGLYACGPAAAVAEEVAGGWLKELFGLPAQTSFGLVTGCQMAHATCLAAARHALLASRGIDVEEEGLAGTPPIRILTSRNRHASFERAVRLVGIGRGRIEVLDTDDHDALVPAALEAALAADHEAPTIVLLQAGDVNIGACDDFASLIPLARDHGAWIHVDGAFGLWAAASPKLRHLVAGVELADSWATDGHKWLNVPYDCGYAFVAEPSAHRGAMSHRAPYLTHDAAGARDQMDWNPEFSRRARGFATYAALRQLGRDGVAELVEKSCHHAAELVRRIGELPGAEVVWTPTLNQGLLRFPDPRPHATEEDHARHTEEVIAAILETGEAFFGPSTWRGKRVMRVSVSGWQTTGDDIDRVVAAVAAVLRAG
jgi:glutamate/tyrosine decarboxylase-like PLP-dependent enzyme